MSSNIGGQAGSLITLTSSGASLTNGSAGVGNGTANLNAASGGNCAGMLACRLELIAQWATVTGIVANTIAAEIYLLPALDGTNYPDIDTTAGSSVLPWATLVGLFTFSKAPAANTNVRFISERIELEQLLYKPYILIRCGQTVTANWTLNVVPFEGQTTP